jgi:hypothetical protein
MSDYGKRGGSSPTAGKKASVYQATAPDGHLLRKATYKVSVDTAVLYAYQRLGEWHAAGVREKRSWDMDHYTALDARRIR